MVVRHDPHSIGVVVNGREWVLVAVQANLMIDRPPAMRQ
jgi:hypothetical protein